MYLVGDRVPLRLRLFGGGMLWRFDRMSLYDERVEIYHFGVSMERIEDCLPAYAGWQSRDCDEVGSFGHCAGEFGKYASR